MTYTHDGLRPIDWQLLDAIGRALTGHAASIPVEHRPLQGWPFAWLLHPGFSDGLTVGDSTSLYRLQDCGLIQVRQSSGSRSGDDIFLTRQGHELVERRLGRSSSRNKRASNSGATPSHQHHT